MRSFAIGASHQSLASTNPKGDDLAAVPSRADWRGSYQLSIGEEVTIDNQPIPESPINPSTYMSIPPGGMAGAFSFSGMSVTSALVVRIIAAIEQAFSTALRVTFTGSMMPAVSMST